ncbi:MAG: hypothetical protein FWG40_01715 [Peptococcaceae bacterium]|nr:hypothetical protein [Peptococcaceae bacterium]
MKHKWIIILFVLCLIPALSACDPPATGNEGSAETGVAAVADTAAYEALIETGYIDLGKDRFPPLAKVAPGWEPIDFDVFDGVPGEIIAGVYYAIEPGGQAQAAHDAELYFRHLLEEEGFEKVRPGAVVVDEYTVYYLRKDSADAGMAVFMRIYYNRDELVLDFMKKSADLIQMQVEDLYV